jgi:phospholipase/carboxylesterase
MNSTAAELPEAVVVETGQNPRNAVIWLHGLGADGHDFESVVPMLGLTESRPTRFVFPHAPVRPVTLNGGMPMRAWYDIIGMQFNRDQDEDGIKNSAALVTALIEREIGRGIPRERIVLAGFSQGGAIAVYLATRFPRRLAGIMALSTYLLFEDRLEVEQADANLATPVFVGHGTHDPMVPVAMGQALADRLAELSYPVEFRRYPIPHSVSADEIGDIGRWLRARLD